MFLGKDLLAYLVLALGGALLVGNVAAIFRPPDQPREKGSTRAGTGDAQRGDLSGGPGGRRLSVRVPGRGVAARFPAAPP